MSNDYLKERQRLRNYLNPSIKGPNVDIVLDALARGTSNLIHNVSAVNDQLYIVTASDSFLDQRLSDNNLSRPEKVGLSDEIFRELGIAVTNRKQVRDLILSVLEIMYGYEFTRAISSSNRFEPYSLRHGDNLIIQFDDEMPVEITFLESQFTNISSANAVEIADVITRNINRLGRRGSAIARDDGEGEYVVLISETKGPSSSIRVLGGKAQNVLRFDTVRPTTATSYTQWTLTQVDGGNIRATWTAGTNPSLGMVQRFDYVNIYGNSFEVENRGTFTVTNVKGGLVNKSYVEFTNPSGVPQIVTQGSSNAMLFFNPARASVNSKKEFAVCYQTESRLLEIFMPATTKVVRRERRGAAHLHVDSPSTPDMRGPHIFDVQKPFLVGQEECHSTTLLNASSDSLIQVDNAIDIPDKEGKLVVAFGTSREEIVPYISRPSIDNILINPSYKFKHTHPIGTNFSLIEQSYAYRVASDGSDYPLYITDTISGRIYAEELINEVSATGINVIITILYPDDIGLGHWGKETSEKFIVWGE